MSKAITVGVISDTHGSMSAIKKAVDFCKNADIWLHSRDHCRDAELLTKLTGSQVFSVCGNCDGISSSAGVDEFINVGDRKIWLTHGHKYNVKHSPAELAVWAKQYAADIVIYGHTHTADITWLEAVLLFNPGSVAYPRGKAPTCGKLEIGRNGIKPKVILLNSG